MWTLLFATLAIMVVLLGLVGGVVAFFSLGEMSRRIERVETLCGVRHPEKKRFLAWLR
jgi:hypothetical protein